MMGRFVSIFLDFDILREKMQVLKMIEKKATKKNDLRKTSIVVGILFIIATVVSILAC
jgi:hypothetical protein